MDDPSNPQPPRYKHKISRRVKKFTYDESRILPLLPKEVPEKLWTEILQREEADLIVFDIREEIIETAMDIYYEKYMERQATAFTVHCAAEAWMQLLNLNFLRHDPGEDPTAFPRCDIPNRRESWVPDKMPDTSPKDAWAFEALPVSEVPVQSFRRFDSSSTLDLEEVQPIPSEYWFPGKIKFPGLTKDEETEAVFGSEEEEQIGTEDGEERSVTTMLIDSEVLQKVTEYNKDIVSPKETLEDIPEGAGGDCRSSDATTRKSKKSKQAISQPRVVLPPLKEPSKIVSGRPRMSNVFEVRRPLRLDPVCDVSMERLASSESGNKSTKGKSPKKKK